MVDKTEKQIVKELQGCKPRKKGKIKKPAQPTPADLDTQESAQPAQPARTGNQEERQLKELQDALSKLSKKALKKLTILLNSNNDRVKMQAALGAIRATVQALTKDTTPAGSGAEIHIHTSAAAVVAPGQVQAPGSLPSEIIEQPKRIGQAIAIVK
jgi:hypothetical protein